MGCVAGRAKRGGATALKVLATAWLPLAGLALLAALPAVLTPYTSDLVVKIIILAVFALSLELLVGMTGLVSLGHAAFLGLGAYTAVLVSPEWEAANLALLLPACVGVAALYALFVGALSLRTQGVYFIMVTLAFAQMAYYVVHDTPLGGGTDGIYLDDKPSLVPAWLPGLELRDPMVLYFFIWLCLAATFVKLALLLRSRFGRALLGIKVNEQRLRAAGFSTYPYKLAAFTLSGGIAGAAGSLFAIKDGFVNPELLSWHFSGAVLIMIILGGLGHLRGALVGAFAFALLQEFFKSEALFGTFAKHWHLGLGITIILCVAFLPHGLVGLPAQWRARKARRSAGARAVQAETPGEAAP